MKKKICVYDCSSDTEYLYEYKNKCYKNCPGETKKSNDNTNLCLIACPESSPFEKDGECLSYCSSEDFFNEICIINNKNTQAKENMVNTIKNEITDLLDSFSNSLNNGIDLIIRDNNEFYQITSINNQNNNEYNNGETIINIGECEQILKEKNGISNDKSLIIYKMDYFIDGLLIPITEYEIYNPITYEKLNLNVCKETTININIPIIIDENNLYKYNPYSEYYKDECYPDISECGNGISLEERKNEFNNNYLSLCENNCEYKDYNTNTKKVLCECKVKTNFVPLSDILNNKNGLLYHINLDSTYKIIDPNECLFIEKETKKCENYIRLEELIEQKYLPLNTKNSIDKVFELFSEQLKNIDSDYNEIIEGENIIYHMTTTEEQNYYLDNNLYSNISSIDFGDCEKILQKEYQIDEPLIIIKVDIKRNDTISTQVEYQAYNPYTLEILNLSYCDNVKINIYPPIKLDKETYDLLIHLREQGYDLFNSNDDFYNNLCSPYNSYNNTDVLLNDRRNDFYIHNITLCEENCEYEDINIESLKVKCNCDIKTEVNSNTTKVSFSPNKVLENFYKIEKYANIRIIVCYSQVFNLDKLKKNYGSYILLFISSFFIIVMIINFLTINDKIRNIIQNLISQYTLMLNKLKKIEQKNEKEPKKKINKTEYDNKKNKLTIKNRNNKQRNKTKNDNIIKNNDKNKNTNKTKIKLKTKSNPIKKMNNNINIINTKFDKRISSNMKYTSNNKERYNYFCNTNNNINSKSSINEKLIQTTLKKQKNKIENSNNTKINLDNKGKKK